MASPTSSARKAKEPAGEVVMAEPVNGTGGVSSVKTPPLVLPRRITGVAKAQTSTTGVERGRAFQVDNYVDTTVDYSTLRGYQQTSLTIRSLYETDGLLASAVSGLVSIAATPYRLQSYQTGTGEFSREGLRAAESVCSLLNTLHDYSSGYSDQQSIGSLVSQMLLELALVGSVGVELVLDTARFPRKLVTFAGDGIVWLSNGKGGRYPAQRPKGAIKSGAQLVELNIPTVWVAELGGMADTVYAVPPLSSAIQRLSHYADFISDLWRVVKQSGIPRTTVELDYEKVMASAPPEVRSDPAKVKEYLDSVREQIETQLQNLAPEDCLVYYNVATVNLLRTDGEKADFTELLQNLSGLAATALKTSPTQLGLRIGGSQNVASTEAMLLAKYARSLQKAVEEVLSRALTLAIRILGVDAYVQFELAEPDLRPSSELEAFMSLKQNRILELLSLGRITDDEAQALLGLGSLPETAEELSGTKFYSAKPMQTLPSGNDDPNGRGVASRETPKSSGGRDQQRRE